MKRIVFAVLIALLAFNGWSRSNEPDFNYPKEVTKQAEADLKKALASGDGQMVVDAIVRASIAQSQLSREKMSEIINRIDRTAANEKNPATRALLRHFEAVVMNSYSKAFMPTDRLGDDDIRVYDPHPEATARDPYAKWTKGQFQARIDELVTQSLADSAALCASQVTDFQRIITCDKLGASYVPTLYQFLIKEGIPLVSRDVKKRLRTLWESSTVGNITAHTWARMESIDDGHSWSSDRDAYRKLIASQPGAEINGLLLDYLNDDEDYDVLRDYVKRYPKSIYANDVRNNISHIERTSAKLVHDGQRNSREQVPVRMNVRNVNQFSIDVYRLSDDMCSSEWKEKTYELKKLQRVK